MKLRSNAVNLRVRRSFDPSDLLLYAVTDSRMNKKWGHSIEHAVQAAVEGGATIIQLRFAIPSCFHILVPLPVCLVCGC